MAATTYDHPADPPLPFRVTLALDGEHALMEVHGDLDMASAPLLESAVRRALFSGARRLEIDLTPTRFVDVAGLRALLAARAVAQTYGGTLAVACLPGPCRRVFELTGNEELLA